MKPGNSAGISVYHAPLEETEPPNSGTEVRVRSHPRRYLEEKKKRHIARQCCRVRTRRAHARRMQLPVPPHPLAPPRDPPQQGVLLRYAPPPRPGPAPTAPPRPPFYLIVGLSPLQSRGRPAGGRGFEPATFPSEAGGRRGGGEGGARGRSRLGCLALLSVRVGGEAAATASELTWARRGGRIRRVAWAAAVGLCVPTSSRP